MKDRIKAIRKEEHMTQAEFAEQIGLSRNFIAQVETGVKSISDRTISDICRAFRINREWLENGTEPMRFPEPDRDEEARILAELSENLDDPVCAFVRDVMSVYISLDRSEREIAKKIATAILAKTQEQQ